VALQGTFSHTWDVWEKCLVLMGERTVDLGEVITHELPLDQWQKGFDLMETKEGLKIVLTPID
jgi:threonine dehydrogenase-like Zn-dependent dehydrogenase